MKYKFPTGNSSRATGGQRIIASHILLGTDGPRTGWRTMCGRDASEYNTLEQSREQFERAASSFACTHCLRKLRKMEGSTTSK